ncbi:hypothetical protein GDO86_001176 [Hymenochirus boettgeri]|uniref:Unconventional myosin-IXb n=1 Tax=Hymenochirus boettgeri TaxID=247094 RepID=A0A8T2KET2_9PIPI|nr:hypothetical protein GDO86_001176 [Hymenochirus boettgeri]
MSLKNDTGHQQLSHHLYIYPQLSHEGPSYCTVLATKEFSASDVIKNVVSTLGLDSSKPYVLAEVKESGGEEWVLDPNDSPVQRLLLWPRKAQDKHQQSEGYYFLLQEKDKDGRIKYAHLPLVSKEEEARRLMERGFLPRLQEDYNDLCNLPKLTEDAILENLKTRFLKHQIYTYAGSILIAINPFKFLPIYNPKYVKMYDNHQLGKLEPHIFAIADVSYHTMLKKRVNQCIVISGESGSGKTQSTNFLIHCLTALSQKGYASGVERTILGAGPVLEAFGNAKTAHNNNSSRFGKFIQVNYLESGIVRGAVVEKYLLEKSRLVSQEKNERNYHVFYYLLLGVSEEERKEFQLKQPEDYFYLNQNNFKVEEGEDLRHDFERLKQAMEMVGFLPATKNQIFSVLSAILYLGNVTYKKKASGRDEGLDVGPPEVLDTLSQLLQVKTEMLVEALTKRKTVTVNEKLILPYSLNEAITARDSMAKSLYSALFDWIVLRINHALLNKKDVEESVNCLSIGVLDIFGFEDFENNSFEQFCINYANEQLQYYFNQHIFKLEQEEYQEEGICWHNIDYTDNVGCIQLISKKPTGLFYLLDEESNFPHATNRTLLAKFKQQHDENKYFVATPVMEPAFIIRHFAGKVKYQIKDFREKNTDYMRPDIVALLRSSDSGYIRELIGMDPVAVFRWSVLRAAIRAMAVLNEAARQRAERTAGGLQRSNNPMEKIYRKTKSIRQKQLIPKNLLDSQSLKIIMGMTLHDRTTKSLLHLHKKKKPPSISAQFQTSLNKLLETLGKAEPFFIRCIRSNAEKMEMRFDESLVLQQLRYTGMLETVRIRRSGYSAKYTYEEFVNQFQVLLPKHSPVPKTNIATLFKGMCLDHYNYQLGKTKVFMKELERQILQDHLHQAVIKKIILLQSLFRMVMERRNFLRMKMAAVSIQACWRLHCVRQELEIRKNSAVCIQSFWRGYVQRRVYIKRLQFIRQLQALCRGYLQRKRYKEMLEVKKKAAEEEEMLEVKKKAAEEEERKRLKNLEIEREVAALLEKAKKEEELKSKEDEPPLVQTELEKGPKKLAVQKKKSNEQSSHSEPIQTTDSKHTFKSPLYRLLGRKPEKKNSKETPLTPDGTEDPNFLPHPLEATATKRTIDGIAATGPSNRIAGVEPANKIRRNRSIKISKVTTVSEKWKASLYREINNSTELKHLDDFLFGKINAFNSEKSGVENLLIKAIENFRSTLKSMYSSPNGHIHAGYKDLMENFQLHVSNLTQEKEEKDVKLVLNLFQSFLDEYTRGYKREDTEFHKPRKSQKKKRKQAQTVEIHGHVFMSYQVNIGQSCEHCSSSIWPMEKALLCSTCKMVCHKKCLTKILTDCASVGGRKNLGSHHFGVHVADLTNEKTSVPVVMEMLLEYLEIHGLYSEGIYRKSGAANRMRELKESLEKDPSMVKLDNYPIHAITGILKQWLRELPEPLMTFAQYNEFLRAVELPGKQEQLCAIYKVLGQLPQANYNSLERLIFHLVKVAEVEEVNRMSPNSLAIVFAPCLLRCPDNYDPLTSMKEVAKTTMCVEMLIKEQMRQYKIRMQEIGLLEAAESRAVCRLSLLRYNTGKNQPSNGKGKCDLNSVQEKHISDSEVVQESHILMERIQCIKEEKEEITYRLPEMDQRCSDEENMDSESSNSTESLLDEKPTQSEKEGQIDGAQPQAPLFTLSAPQSNFKRRPSSFLAKMRLHRKNPFIQTANIKLPPELTKAGDTAEDPALVRRREQPGRRTDNIQSVYLPEGTELGKVQGILEYEPTAKLKRRFSDPHIQLPCPEESNL